MLCNLCPAVDRVFYRKIRMRRLDTGGILHRCPWCSHHNCGEVRKRVIRSWKHYRRTQYRVA